MKIDEWVLIEEFPDYEINRSGVVRNRKTRKIKNPTPMKGMYPKVSLQKGHKQYARNVHVLLARAFIPNPMGKPEVNHIDGNKSNNNLDNLEWVTRSENMVHARRTGLHKSDGDKPVSQYTRDGEYVASYKSISEASRKTGVDISGISRVARGKRYCHTAGGYVWKWAK